MLRPTPTAGVQLLTVLHHLNHIHGPTCLRRRSFSSILRRSAASSRCAATSSADLRTHSHSTQHRHQQRHKHTRPRHAAQASHFCGTVHTAAADRGMHCSSTQLSKPAAAAIAPAQTSNTSNSTTHAQLLQQQSVIHPYAPEQVSS